jgi:hypothetical protein
MKLKYFSLLVVLLAATSITAQQPSFTVVGIRPFEKAVPGQVMEVLIEGLGSGTAPMMIPETDFEVTVSQDGSTQPAKVRIAKYTMIRERNPENPNNIADMKLLTYRSVSFVVPAGLRPGPAEVIASYKGRRGNSVRMEIVEKPLTPVVGTTSVIAVGGVQPERTAEMTITGNDLGWRLERGTTVNVFVNPLVDPDDPNAAVLIRFRQGNNDYEAITRIKSTPARVAKRGQGVGFFVAREELELDVPAALTLGKAQVEIRSKANGQVSDPVTLTATITDVTRIAEAPSVSAPRLLAVTPTRVGAGQSLLISIDQRRTLEPSPKETRVVIERENARYFATIEQNTALIGPGKAPDQPVGIFVRTTRELIGRVQIRVLNPLRGEQTGLSAPVAIEIVDEVLPPELTSVNESTENDFLQLKEMYELAKQAGQEFSAYDPNGRYLTVRVRGIDYNPSFVRATLEQGDKKITLQRDDFSSFLGDVLIVKLPKGLAAGEVKFTLENSGGDDRYSTPATKTFVLQSGS